MRIFHSAKIKHKLQKKMSSSSNQASASPGLCTICKKEQVKKCDKCGASYSTCEKSETQEYYIHKYKSCSCGKSKKFKQVYGILIPETSEKPVMMQIDIKKVKCEYEDEYFDYPDIKSFMGDGQSMVDFGRLVMDYNPWHPEKVLNDTLEINFRDNFFNDGSIQNKLIRKLGKNNVRHDWRGPMLVFKYEGKVRTPYPSYIDINFADLSHVIDYMAYYGGSSELEMTDMTGMSLEQMMKVMFPNDKFY